MRKAPAPTTRFLIGSTLLTTALLVACGKTTNSSPSAAPPAPVANQPANLNPNYPNGGGNPGFAGGAISGGGLGRGPIGPSRPGLPIGEAIVDTGGDFDPHDVLTSEMGDWVRIGRQECFRPRVERDWVPFRHGYWGYDSDRGWSFESYDKFGKATDHYGAWRHAPEQGWVSCPFPDHKYRASTVTFFDHRENIGWSPYISGEPELYAGGAAAGFDDGYWQGESLFAGVSLPGFSFNVGFTLINQDYIGAEDINEHIIVDQALTFNVVLFAQRAHRLNLFPGPSREHAYEFFAPFFRGRSIPVGRLAPVDCGNGRHYLAPTGVNWARPLPPIERPRLGLPPIGQRPPPVGHLPPRGPQTPMGQVPPVGPQGPNGHFPPPGRPTGHPQAPVNQPQSPRGGPNGGPNRPPVAPAPGTPAAPGPVNIRPTPPVNNAPVPTPAASGNEDQARRNSALAATGTNSNLGANTASPNAAQNTLPQRGQRPSLAGRAAPPHTPVDASGGNGFGFGNGNGFGNSNNSSGNGNAPAPGADGQNGSGGRRDRTGGMGRRQTN